MIQIKIFKNKNLDELIENTNNWFKNNNFIIIEHNLSIDLSSNDKYILSILYENGKL